MLANILAKKMNVAPFEVNAEFSGAEQMKIANLISKMENAGVTSWHEIANNYELAQLYTTVLDELYEQRVLTGDLDAPEGWVQAAMQANEIRIPKIIIQGLANYARGVGYVVGNSDFQYETHQFTQERGRRFNLDRFDNIEALETPLMAITTQFIRTKVVPEVDSYRFATLVSKAGNRVNLRLDASNAVEAIDDATAVLRDESVELMDCILYVSSNMYKYMQQSDRITQTMVVNLGNRVIDREVEMFGELMVRPIPQPRFYDSITIYDGETAGQEDGGYVPAPGAESINFIIVDTNATYGVTKMADGKIWDPENNQIHDGWSYDYRLYHDLFVPDNKVPGVYAHVDVTPAP